MSSDSPFQSLPKSGGAKNYLEFMFNKPENQWLMTCIFAIYSSISVSQSLQTLGYRFLTLVKQRSSAPSSIIFGNCEPSHILRLLPTLISKPDALRALGIDPSPSNVRALAHYCLTFVAFVHSLNVTFGIRIQNFLGIFKLLVLAAIAIAGILSLAGVSGFQVRDGYDKPHNYEWNNFWEGTVIVPEALSSGFYNVLWYALVLSDS